MTTEVPRLTEKQTYILAGACFLSAALLGAIYLTIRNAKPCPCAEHQPEAEAARIAQASAEIAEPEMWVDQDALVDFDQTVSTTNGKRERNSKGHFVATDQGEPTE